MRAWGQILDWDSLRNILAEQTNKIESILFPTLTKRMNFILGEKKRFVHYTTASSARGILENKEVWLRQPICMNDYSEIQHGYNCLLRAYSDKSLISLKETFDEVFDGISVKIEEEFDNSYHFLFQESYIFCMSEHEDKEDLHGRLSMWRAYGKDTGVAIVMNSDTIFSKDDDSPYRTFFVPVNYLTDQELIEEINNIANKIKENIEYLRSLGEESFKQYVLALLRLIVLSTKHPGFSEEKEWRVIYMPTFYPSEYVKHSIETINGIPQDIYKIPIKNIPEANQMNFEFNNLIDRVIIGPTEYNNSLWRAFYGLLGDAGVLDQGNKINNSNVPLRKG